MGHEDKIKLTVVPILPFRALDFTRNEHEALIVYSLSRSRLCTLLELLTTNSHSHVGFRPMEKASPVV